jgi:hypothetical protein
MRNAAGLLLVSLSLGGPRLAERPSESRRRSRADFPASVGLSRSLVVAVLFLAGCSTLPPQTTHGPTAAPGGLTKDEAVARAMKVLPANNGVPAVVWASIESDPFSPRGNAPPGPLTWIVRLQGGLAASPCPSGSLDRVPAASDPACLDGEGGIDVVLDYYSGDLLGWSH